MRDFNDLIKVLKRMVVETMNTELPTQFMFGKVTSSNPLKINVEQRMELDSNFLILTRNVTNQTGSVVIDGKSYTVSISHALKTGDKVILLRQHGGQKFVVLDKVV